MKKLLVFILLCIGYLYAQSDQIFITLATDIQYADVTIIEHAIPYDTYEKYRQGELKKEELPERGKAVHLTTPVGQQRVDANQVIRLIVKKKGFVTYDKYIPIKSENLKISLDEFKSKSKPVMVLKNIIIPGWGQFHTDRKGAGGRFIVLDVVMLGAASVFYLKSESHYSNFEKYRDSYEKSTSALDIQLYTEKRDKEKDNYEKYNAFLNYALYGYCAVWFWSMIDGFVNAPGKEDIISFNIQPGHEQFFATVMINF